MSDYEQRLPAADPAGTTPAPGTASNRRPVVLVVDDDAAVRNLCMAYLSRLGYEGLAAEGGEQALALFAQRPDVDCVLLDLTMPRMDGVETFRALRRVRADARVILSSGFSEQDAVGQLHGEGLSGFVQKPFRLGDLRDRLRDVLG